MLYYVKILIAGPSPRAEPAIESSIKAWAVGQNQVFKFQIVVGAFVVWALYRS